MSQTVFGIFDLTFFSPPMELQVHFVKHSKTRGADGVTETFQASVRLAGEFPVKIKKSVHDIPDCVSPLGNMKIFIGYQLGDGEAIVYLHHADFFSWIADTGVFIGLGAALAGGEKVIPVPVIICHFLAATQRQLKRLD